MSLERLRSFLMVAEAGAISRAAPGDPVRQSQISRQIGELEEALGIALVERRGRGLAVTGAGERLAVVVREALQGLQDVAAGALTEPVCASLCAGDSMLHGWAIPAIARLLGRTPQTSVTLTAVGDRDAITRVTDARVDFAILRAHTMPVGLRSRRLGTIAYALFVPRALRPRGRALGVLELIGNVPYAAQYGDAELAASLDGKLREARLHAKPGLICETFPQAQRAVMTGRFAAVLPTFARLDLPKREFDEVPLSGLPAITVMLAWHRRLERQRPRVAALVPQLVEALSLDG